MRSKYSRNWMVIVVAGSSRRLFAPCRAPRASWFAVVGCWSLKLSMRMFVMRDEVEEKRAVR